MNIQKHYIMRKLYFQLPKKNDLIIIKKSLLFSIAVLFANLILAQSTTFSAAPSLGSAASFGVFSGASSGMTNQGSNTVIHGSMGTTGASSTITGFHDAVTAITYTEASYIGKVCGGIYTGTNAGTITTQALSDIQAAYNTISPGTLLNGYNLASNELGGLTLTKGVYLAVSTLQITGSPLILDAANDSTAVWIFQAPSSLTIGTNTVAQSVSLINGALAKNVFWYVGSSAVINYGGGGTMVGTIISSAGTTVSSPGVSATSAINGRVFALNASVTMVNTVLNASNTWTGATNTAWTTVGNWSTGVVPVSKEEVLIPNVTTNQPAIGSGTARLYNLVIYSGATLTVTGNLGTEGSITNTNNSTYTISSTGSLIATSGTISLDGVLAQTIPASTFNSNTIQNLVINNSAGVTLGGTLKITGSVIPTAGLLTTGGYLTLVSTSGSNASITQGSGSYLSGNVIVQRYIGSNIQWRMIGFPFTSSTTIAETALAGFYSSGYKAYTYNEGADDQTNYNFNNGGAPNAGWVQFTSGTTTANKGLLTSGGTISSVINFSGPVNTGTQNITLTKGKSGWNFITNPFASNLNWTTVYTANSANIAATVYRLDPATTAYGSYNANTTAQVGNQGNVIENGAGFFVDATTATSLSVTESAKSTSAVSASMFGVQSANDAKSIIKLSLSKQGDQYADEVVVRWGGGFAATDNFDAAYDGYDLGRAVGPDLSVIGNDKTVYSIFHGAELKNNIEENRTVQLGIKNMEEGTYQIGIQLLSAIANSNKAYLFDSYTNQYTLIDGSTDIYSFITTSDAKSQSNTRFSIAMNAKLINDNNNTNYPVTLLNNPSTGNLFILYSKNNYNQLQWQLVDASGRLLQAGLLSNVMKGSTYQINAGNTTQGNYFIKLTGDGNALPVLKALKN